MQSAKPSAKRCKPRSPLGAKKKPPPVAEKKPRQTRKPDSKTPSCGRARIGLTFSSSFIYHNSYRSSGFPGQQEQKLPCTLCLRLKLQRAPRFPPARRPRPRSFGQSPHAGFRRLQVKLGAGERQKCLKLLAAREVTPKVHRRETERNPKQPRRRPKLKCRGQPNPFLPDCCVQMLQSHQPSEIGDFQPKKSRRTP